MSDTTQQHPFDTEHIACVLARAYPTDEANRRAKNIVSDVQRIGINPTLNLLPIDEGHWVP